MQHTMDCTANITAQDATYPTYKKVDCDLHINANDDNFYGRLIDCTVVITNVLVTACRSWNQGIRLVVTIDDVDVSNALIGSLNIQHNKNMISTASLNLGKTIYSPRTNSHIDLEKVIVITAYINGQEKKLFTGLTDEPSAENTPAFRVIITSRDYGKKLLDKKDTLACNKEGIFVGFYSWEEGIAQAIYTRHKLIEHIAEHAGITDYDIPEMDNLGIANSFSHQSLWDMIQKEAMVNLCWVKFNEDNIMQLKLDEIKSDTSLYPTPDWSYDEDRIIRLGYKRGRIDINKIIILGNTYVERKDVIGDEEILLNYNKSWSASDDYNDIVDTITRGKFQIEIERLSVNIYNIQYRVIISWQDNDYKITSWDVAGNNINIFSKTLRRKSGKVYVGFLRYGNLFDHNYEAGAIYIYLKGSQVSIEEQYDQISASVTDPNSIAKYGERDGGSIEYPLLETEAQCEAVGSKIIRDSHRLGQQADFEIPFNPLIQTGQTIAITDKKIGVTERYYIESINYNIETNEGKIKARTQIGGVYYT